MTALEDTKIRLPDPASLSDGEICGLLVELADTPTELRPDLSRSFEQAWKDLDRSDDSGLGPLQRFLASIERQAEGNFVLRNALALAAQPDLVDLCGLGEYYGR